MANLLAGSDPDAGRLADNLARRVGRKLSTRTGPFRSPRAAVRLSQCRLVFAPAFDPYADEPPAAPHPDPDCEMADDDITWAMTVPGHPDAHKPRWERLRDRIEAHILDPDDPEDGELTVPIPEDLWDHDPDESGVELVTQADATDYWEAVHKLELNAELLQYVGGEVVVDDREYRVPAEALDALRAATPDVRFEPETGSSGRSGAGLRRNRLPVQD